MTWRAGLWPLLFAVLHGCFPTFSAPTVIPISDLTPSATDGMTARETVFTLVMDRFRDERSNRSTLGQYDALGKGGFAGTVTITSDRDITEVFEDLVKKSLNRKGIQQGPSPFVLKGSIKKAGVGATPDSKTLRAEAFLELTIVNSNTGAYIWKKSFLGAASGVDPKITLAHAFQDLAVVVDQDDSLLALRPAFLASGGKAPEVAASPPRAAETGTVTDLPKIAVWDLASRNVPVTHAQELTSILVSEISKIGRYEVYSQDNVRTLAGWTAERMQLGCTDTKCLTALGQMDVGRLISGSIGKIGDTYTVSLNLFDTHNVKAEKSISEFCRSENELIGLIQQGVHKLLAAVP